MSFYVACSRTWVFEAENVRDFAWASSRKFIWDAMIHRQEGGEHDEVLAMSFYPNEAEPMWSQYSTHSVVHTMEVYSLGELLKVYTVAVGRGGAGPKRYSGDEKTPEGSYRIDSRHASRKYHRFLHVSYPNRRDRAAFREGKRKGTIPASRGIGGAIGIHGEKKGFVGLPHKLVDWTLGCIAVDNDEVEELYRAIVVDAVIEIRP